MWNVSDTMLPAEMKLEMHTTNDTDMFLIGTAALEEDAQILRVIEAYCTGASLHQSTTGVCVFRNCGHK